MRKQAGWEGRNVERRHKGCYLGDLQCLTAVTLEFCSEILRTKERSSRTRWLLKTHQRLSMDVQGFTGFLKDKCPSETFE